MDGSGRGIIEGTIPAFAWRDEADHENPVRIACLRAEI
jgi:hypothetical protein